MAYALGWTTSAIFGVCDIENAQSEILDISLASDVSHRVCVVEDILHL